MSALLRCFGVAVVVASLVEAASTAEADPITITGGGVAVGGPSSGHEPPYGLVVTGDGLTFSADVFGGGGSNGQAGGLLSANGSVNPTRLFDVPRFEVVDGVPYTNVFPGGFISFTAQPVLLPPGQDLATFEFTTPFTATGQLEGFSDAMSTVPLFSVDVIGDGTAQIGGIIHGSGANSIYVTNIVDYEFSPAPTPEPASILLLGTGLAALIARRFRSGKA